MPYEPLKRPPTAAQVMKVVRQEEHRTLKDVGRYVRNKAAKYPAKVDSSTYKRTGTLGRKITVSDVCSDGRALYVLVGIKLHYARYVEEGTGLYGPKGQVIRPKSAKVLAWRAQGPVKKGTLVAKGLRKRKGKLVHAPNKDIFVIFAQWVRGMKGWHYMQKAFEAPETAAYYKARVGRMYYDIRQALTQLQ